MGITDNNSEKAKEIFENRGAGGKFNYALEVWSDRLVFLNFTSGKFYCSSDPKLLADAMTLLAEICMAKREDTL